jgi:processive rubber oxygenase RoxA-like protein
MKKITVLGFIILSCLVFSAFIKELTEEKPIPIPASKQRLGGSSLKGYEYLISGDYVKSGIPYNIFFVGAGKSKENYLKRNNLNLDVSHEFTVIKAANGEILVAPNCLKCHAQVFEDQLVIGLGNTMIDFSRNQKVNAENLEMLEAVLKRNFPKQYEASASFLTVTKTVAPFLIADVRGVNTADRLAAVLASHRDPVTFEWNDEGNLEIPDEVIPTDTPPWWILKKKNAMFYNGFGRGDFGRFLMASNLLTVNDTLESREVDKHMPDVLAYIYSLKAPGFPKQIDYSLAEKGRILFQNTCAKCHGTYGKKQTYPNLLIPESIIQTDSFLFKSNYSNPQFVNWFNSSWFTKGDHPARLEPFNGYIAPPLDGIWVTAPYLHNGSVPTLDALLNSSSRPTYWSRDFENAQYDYENIGWKYKVHDKTDSGFFYNTEKNGYGNYGHYFGDVLTDKERRAVIEYLKTL